MVFTVQIYKKTTEKHAAEANFSLFTFHFFCTFETTFRMYFRSKKQKKCHFIWFFAHLFVPLHPLSA